MSRSLITPSKIGRIDELVDKYMSILHVRARRPIIKFESGLGPKHLGICTWRLSEPDTTTIALHTSILDDERTLERIVAHEMVHHLNMTSLSDEDKRLLASGYYKSPGHGADFKAGANTINSVMGSDFVTEKSDQGYVTAPNTKPYYLLIWRYHAGGPLGWAWCARLTPKIREQIARKTAEGGKLIVTTDDKWTVGPKIERFGKIQVPKAGSGGATELLALYNNTPSEQSYDLP